jgi:hypothetical protein
VSQPVSAPPSLSELLDGLRGQRLARDQRHCLALERLAH